jgi:methionyl-tRNA formyltransferase
MKYTVVIAGSTHHTCICAEALVRSQIFTITGVLTPPPKPIGRKQILTANPLQQFADTQSIPIFPVGKRIDQAVRHELESVLKSAAGGVRPDFLLVVDFGYIVPNWLLELPKIAPINIHPSLLPRWRGSSPGQFVLLYGEKESAVSVIVMNDLLDQGPIITQLPLAVAEDWTQTEYYQHSFQLVGEKLPAILEAVAEQKILPQPQPLDTPTAIAGRFTKEDGFVPWPLIQAAMTGESWDETLSVGTTLPLSPILTEALRYHRSPTRLVFHASHALSPWPGLWTVVPTARGEKRMKVLKAELSPTNPAQLELVQVQLEGKSPALWNEAKQSIISLEKV